MMPVNLVLGTPSDEKWLDSVLQNFDFFLIDHAANERKASSMAISLAVHYPDRAELVDQMVDLAVEELNHFRQVMRLMLKRGLIQQADEKDLYINLLLKDVRKESEDYFLDRLLVAAVVEARGAERFELISKGLKDLDLVDFYQKLAISESRHYRLFLDLAAIYFREDEIEDRLQQWLKIEADIIKTLPATGRLH